MTKKNITYEHDADGRRFVYDGPGAESEHDKYMAMSDEFRDLDRQVRQARHRGDLSDELELQHFKAEKALRAQEKTRARARIAEARGGGA